jgi:hypothetical protein
MGSEEAAIESQVSAFLEDGEAIQAIVSGFFGTLPRGGYDATPVPIVGRRGGYAWDPYDLVLTTRRFLALPRGSSSPGVGPAEPPALQCDRSTGHVTVRRKLGPWTWISVVFHDRELRLVVTRRYRENLRRMTEALP